MVKTQKMHACKNCTRSEKHRRCEKGISFEKTVLEQLGLYAENKFSGNRSEAADTREHRDSTIKS